LKADYETVGPVAPPPRVGWETQVMVEPVRVEGPVIPLGEDFAPGGNWVPSADDGDLARWQAKHSKSFTSPPRKE
jgi:hypothetical protein